MLNLGIIGLGEAWESHYAPALEKLRDRIRVCAIYDPVAVRGERVAREWQAASSRGISALLERPDVRAVLLLDPSWYGFAALRFLCKHGKPSFIGGFPADDAEKLRSVFDTGRNCGLTLMPALGQRYTPSTGRLQELMATQLGRPMSVRWEMPLDNGVPEPHVLLGRRAARLRALCDWCGYIVRRPALRIEARPPGASGDGGAGENVVIEYPPAAPQSEPIRAEICLSAVSNGGNGHAANAAPATCRVECERGEAVIESDRDISWRTAAQWKRESLTSDRCEIEVMLDLFCRRVVGGLIPVADIGDVCRSIRMVQAVEESLRRRAPVVLNGRL